MCFQCKIVDALDKVMASQIKARRMQDDRLKKDRLLEHTDQHAGSPYERKASTSTRLLRSMKKLLGKMNPVAWVTMLMKKLRGKGKSGKGEKEKSMKSD